MNEHDEERNAALAELDRALAEAVLAAQEERSVAGLRAQDAATIRGVVQLLWAVRVAEAEGLAEQKRTHLARLYSADHHLFPSMVMTADDTDPEAGEAGGLRDQATFRAEVGRRLRALRMWEDLSQEQLAARAGLTRGFISGVERGTQHLDAWRLRLLTRALRIPSGMLLGEAPEPFRANGGRRPRV